MADEQKAASEKAGSSKEPAWVGLLESAGQKLVTLVLSAGALVGFVAFAGSVVLWTRFFTIHVPPEQAVAAVPQGEAVAIGSVMLLLFGFLGALAVLAVFLIDRGGRATPGVNRGLLLLLAIEGVVAIWMFGGATLDRVLATEALTIALGIAFWATYYGPLIDLEKDLRDLHGPESQQEEVDRPFRRAKDEPGVRWRAVGAVLGVGAVIGVLTGLVIGGSPTEAWVAGLAAFAAVLILVVTSYSISFSLRKAREESARAKKEALKEKQEKKRAEARAKEEARRRAEENAWKRAARKLRRCGEAPVPPIGASSTPTSQAGKEPPKKKPPRFTLAPLGVATMAVLVIIAVVFPSLIIHSSWLAMTLGSAILLGAGLWRIAELSRKRFVWFGLALFISVPLFGTIVLVARNFADPQVQPMALIRNTDGPDEAIQGIYVTENSDRVYFASVATEGCTGDVTPGSGRLLWVPKKEVVAMSVGPLQSLEDARKSALEMSYDLTPAAEAPAGDLLSLTPGERAQEAKEEEEAPQQDQRLDNPGPAVRPNIGSGLSLWPETASPGKEVELRLSVPNEEVEGFGRRPEGEALRLNGVPLTILREVTPQASDAEFVKAASGSSELSLDKKGVYGRHGNRPFLLGSESEYEGQRFVKLDDGSVFEVKNGGLDGEYSEYLAIAGTGVAAELKGKPKVRLERGGPFVPLESKLRRQAWGPERIRFRVPENASSGVVSLECDHLAGQPLLRVTRAPKARIDVRLGEGSARVSLDSSHSNEGGSTIVSRRWTIAGVRRGHKMKMSADLPSRFGTYSVQLTVTTKDGQSNTADLRLLRLPASLFAFDRAWPANRKAVERAAEALSKTVEGDAPAAIEIDGHADDPGTRQYNMLLSLRRAEHLRQMLLAEKPSKDGEEGTKIPVTTLAYGEGCPVDLREGRRPRNRSVDIFVLDSGVRVVPPPTCHPGRFESTFWQLP